MLTRIAIFAGLAICAMSCQRSPDATIVGEWTAHRVDAVDHVTQLTDHVTYRSDHTYTGKFRDARRGEWERSGTWRIEGHQFICRDSEHGESRADILMLTQNHLRVRPPDGVVADYRR